MSRRGELRLKDIRDGICTHPGAHAPRRLRSSDERCGAFTLVVIGEAAARDLPRDQGAGGRAAPAEDRRSSHPHRA